LLARIHCRPSFYSGVLPPFHLKVFARFGDVRSTDLSTAIAPGSSFLVSSMSCGPSLVPFRFFSSVIFPCLVSPQRLAPLFPSPTYFFVSLCWVGSPVKAIIPPWMLQPLTSPKVSTYPSSRGTIVSPPPFRVIS